MLVRLCRCKAYIEMRAFLSFTVTCLVRFSWLRYYDTLIHSVIRIVVQIETILAEGSFHCQVEPHNNAIANEANELSAASVTATRIRARELTDHERRPLIFIWYFCIP